MMKSPETTKDLVDTYFTYHTNAIRKLEGKRKIFLDQFVWIALRDSKSETNQDAEAFLQLVRSYGWVCPLTHSNVWETNRIRDPIRRRDTIRMMEELSSGLEVNHLNWLLADEILDLSGHAGHGCFSFTDYRLRMRPKKYIGVAYFLRTLLARRLDELISGVPEPAFQYLERRRKEWEKPMSTASATMVIDSFRSGVHFAVPFYHASERVKKIWGKEIEWRKWVDASTLLQAMSALVESYLSSSRTNSFGPNDFDDMLNVTFGGLFFDAVIVDKKACHHLKRCFPDKAIFRSLKDFLAAQSWCK